MVTTVLYILLACFESLPTSVIVLGFVSQLLHLSLLTHFPFFYLSSPPFIAAVGAFIVQHCLAFSYFNSTYYPVSEVVAYFTLCVWLVPFGFFLSLSANENILPTRAETAPLLNSNDDFVTGYFSKQGGKRYGLLAFFNYLKEEFVPLRAKKAF
ncbi:hypothetical protein HAZT_HAZT009438 [Hyalella azteca]|uniref:Protein TEX261 n=1 Tax=Hyalella azteca TaxID=294128 RepID=A0A6A0GW98_HYAAZ|nr:hypothetical protein HAZT_HAZT009438 [Hyalella azteca]